MNQTEKRVFLIRRLLDEDRRYRGIEVPADAYEQKRLLRSLMNLRPPRDIDADFLTVQDEYLRREIDAAGCYVPCHACIDNCIHTFAGVQLRWECALLMERQGHEEPTGQAKITKAYNLPCSYVLHTVGPIVGARVSPEDERLLASCYRSCLALAGENGIESIAFCCISTGVFRFPNRRAAEIAVETVRKYKAETGSGMKVIFNVFKDLDLAIYRRILTENGTAEG